MNILAQYHQFIDNCNPTNHDFHLFRYTNLLYLGVDKDGNVCIVCISTMPNRNQLRQRTRLLSIECNVKVCYLIDGKTEQNTVHIIRCYSDSQKEKDIFVELSPLFDEASCEDDQVAALLETVSILSSFFANKTEPSDIELQGLFAELFTIIHFQDSLSLGDYWQTNNRLKFDFSITDKVKIEVKSTTKNERKHHFKHEQLAYELYDIYVISYMLRYDDEGVSLFDLIENVKPMIASDPRRLLILEGYLKNTSEFRLKQCKFNELLASNMRKIYRAQDIPRFSEQAPTGLTNAEYDCNLESAQTLNERDFINCIQTVQRSQN